MNVLPTFVIATTALFLLFLSIRAVSRLNFCAACATISATWLFLLVARLAGWPVSPLLIGVLMGESAVGLYHLLEKRAPPVWLVFRWPFLVTLTIMVYIIIGARSGAALALVLAALWIVWGGVFILRKYPAIKKISEQLIACCRDW